MQYIKNRGHTVRRGVLVVFVEYTCVLVECNDDNVHSKHVKNSQNFFHLVI